MLYDKRRKSKILRKMYVKRHMKQQIDITVITCTRKY